MTEKFYANEIISVPCECGCGIFEIHVWDAGKKGKEYYALYYKLVYGKTSKIKEVIKERVKLLWCILTGKEYIIYDIALYREDLEKFRDELNHVLEME